MWKSGLRSSPDLISENLWYSSREQLFRKDKVTKIAIQIKCNQVVLKRNYCMHLPDIYHLVKSYESNLIYENIYVIVKSYESNFIYENI